MRAWDSGPYYALKLILLHINTQGGPRRNASAQVIGTGGELIPHLYSAGEFGSIWGNMYQGGGDMAECLIFGQLAGKNAAEKIDALPGFVGSAVESNLVYSPGVESDL